MKLIRPSALTWFPPVVIAASLFLVAMLTTPSTYTLGHGVMLASLYALIALTLHLVTQLAMRINRFSGIFFAFSVVLIAAWHVREHLRPAGTVPSLEDWRSLSYFLIVVLVLAALYAIVLTRLPFSWSTKALCSGTVMAGVGFVALLSGFYLGSNTFRWHLHRHNRLIGPVAYHLLAENIATVKTRLWRDQQLLSNRTAAVGSFPRARPQMTEQTRQNIVFILIDTLRADALSEWQSDMPLLSQFARGSLVFSDVRANSSWTQPSVASFFTGLLPEEHGAVSWSGLAPSNFTLAEVLKASGYRTAAFVANPAVVGAAQGFGQGFDEYHELIGTGEPYAQGEEVTQAVHDWFLGGGLHQAPARTPLQSSCMSTIWTLTPRIFMARISILHPMRRRQQSTGLSWPTSINTLPSYWSKSGVNSQDRRLS